MKEKKLHRLPELFRHRLQIFYDFSMSKERCSPKFDAEVKLSGIAAVIWYDIHIRHKYGSPFLAAQEKRESISLILKNAEVSEVEVEKAINYVSNLAMVLDNDMRYVFPDGYAQLFYNAKKWLRQKFNPQDGQDFEYKLLQRKCLGILDFSKTAKLPFLLLDFTIDDEVIKKYLHY